MQLTKMELLCDFARLNQDKLILLGYPKALATWISSPMAGGLKRSWAVLEGRGMSIGWSKSSSMPLMVTAKRNIMLLGLWDRQNHSSGPNAVEHLSSIKTKLSETFPFRQIVEIVLRLC